MLFSLSFSFSAARPPLSPENSSHQACSFPSLGDSIVDPRLRASASNETSLILHLLKRGRANRPSLRASNEHRFTMRVLRARRMVACLLLYLLMPCVPHSQLIK